MEALTVQSLSFAYPNGRQVLHDVTFSLREGSFTVLAGPSGCGKTTLLRLCKPALRPKGEQTGEILFFGTPLSALSDWQQAGDIGFVLQAPEEQLVTDQVWHELAFGLESLGLGQQEIRSRVAEMAGFFGMEDWFERDVSTLSGGQKQMLNLASVMAMQPKMLILDEPTSQLDPIAATDLLNAVARLNRELGITVLMTEHRLEEAIPYADEILILQDGTLKSQRSPAETGKLLSAHGDPLFFAMPVPMRVFAAVEGEGESPVTIREGRQWLSQRSLTPVGAEKQKTPTGEIMAECHGIWFRYEKNSPDVLRDFSVSVRRGELLALLGGNGAGKSTALSLLAGLRKPYRGTVKGTKSVSLLPQNPQTLFSHNTVREELESLHPAEGVLRETVSLCRLESLWDLHPYDLSGGEQQRVALGMVLLTQPELLLLDEPTKGLDVSFKRELAAILHRLAEEGRAIVMVSHDVEFCAEFADRCGFLFGGSIVSEGTPRAFFSANTFYTTAASRMSHGLIEGAVTCNDLIAACGGTPIPPPSLPKGGGEPKREQKKTLPVSMTKRSKTSRKSLLTGLVVLLVLVPLTVYAGVQFFGGRKYYAIALLILAEILVPFFLSFEGRKPAVRELVTVAVLCALGVAGRAAFFMLPQVKPVVAVAVLTGAALGAETGFLVGAMTMLVSNMLFGQGPWTPWQMLALGSIGFFAGVLFAGKGKRPGKLVLTVFGFLASFVLYGGIINPASALMWQTEVSLTSLLPYYLSGLPMDAVLAGTTAVFLWLFSQPVLEKLERIQHKYGLFDS